MLETKPYLTVPIRECGEPLVPICGKYIVCMSPHRFVSIGAPYCGVSPWQLRASVLTALKEAAIDLQKYRPGWSILLTDALRPVAVQKYLVERELKAQAERRKLNLLEMSEYERTNLLAGVMKFWALPSEDAKTPPPHSTGGAIDCTLLNSCGAEVPMGGAVDEIAEHSYPEYYASASSKPQSDWHQNRKLLHDILRGRRFRRHLQEWWHFSLHDQMWAWRLMQEDPASYVVAIYGRII